MGFKYYDDLIKLKKDYFKVLGEFPDFLYDYIDTYEMRRQDGISVTCGNYYSNMFNDKIWWSSLDHSIAVALIIWNFTHDKKQTLSGLFHDISTPCFKHSIDFMNGDAKTQESTEKGTSDVIKKSDEIVKLLKRDNIDISDIDDYKKYPIADNDSPKLSSDRLEYTFSNGLGATKRLVDINTIKKIYNDIIVGTNEDGIEELCFNNIESAEKFVSMMSILSSIYIDPRHKFSMQYLGDIIKTMIQDNYITTSDLYSLSDKELINLIEKYNNRNVAKSFEIWKNSSDVYETDNKPIDRYYVDVEPKIRFIDPLVKIDNNKYVRVSKISESASKDINRAKSYKTKKYIYSNFNF